MKSARQRRYRNMAGGSKRKRRISARVAVRDRWICWLCQEPVDPELEAPHAFSATMDHVTPFSEGGKFSYANLRLAHRVCNMRRAGHNVSA